MIITSTSLYIVDPKKKRHKIKYSIDLSELVSVDVHSGHSGLFILKTNVEDKKDKGSFILHTPWVIECCTKLALAMQSTLVFMNMLDRSSVAGLIQ